MKKSLIGLLLVCLVISLLPLGAMAAETPFVAFNPFPYGSLEDDMLLVKDKLEEMMADDLGITMDWIVVPTDGMLDKLNVMIAGGETPDLVILNIGDADRYAPTPDLMMPLNDLLEEYGQDLLANIPEEAWIPCTNTKGEIIYLPEYSQWRWQGAVIRTDLLEEQGLEVPTNIEELENVMAVFKDAYPDMIPATGLPWFSDPFLQGALDGVASWGEGNYVLNDEGKVVPAMSTDDYRNLVALYKKWVSNGWFDPEFLSGTDDSQTLLWTTGKVGIWFCDPHRALDWNAEAFGINMPEASGAILPIPTNPEGEKKFPISYGVGLVGFIKKDSEHAADIIKYYNKLVSDLDFYLTATNGVEGVHWEDHGDTWYYPEGFDQNHRPYVKIYNPLSWDFMNQQKPQENVHPVHDQLNEEYATADLTFTGLEGFTPDNEAVSMYNPIELETYLPSVIVTDVPIEEFDKIVDQWYATGGAEIVEEYTRQYNEWKAAQGK